MATDTEINTKKYFIYWIYFSGILNKLEAAFFKCLKWIFIAHITQWNLYYGYSVVACGH